MSIRRPLARWLVLVALLPEGRAPLARAAAFAFPPQEATG